MPGMYTSVHKEITAMTTEWTMPRPSQGDVVLYSNDMERFTSPCIAWVLKPPGDTTVQLLTFTEGTGFLVRPSVHHKDDPDLKNDNGWQGLGVWDFTDSAKSAAAAQPVKNEELEEEPEAAVTRAKPVKWR